MRRIGWVAVFTLGCTGAGPTDTDTDETDTEETEDTEVVVGPGPYVLANYVDPCPNGSAIIPGPGEEGHWALAVLTPPTYPFRVDSIAVNFISGDQGASSCQGETTHTVSLWIDSAATPAASPTPLFTGSAATVDVDDDQWILQVEPPEDTVTLTAGQNLFVMVQMAGTAPNVSCIAACRNAQEPERNWWSNGEAAPFSWATLSSFGANVDLLIVAPGEVLPPE